MYSFWIETIMPQAQSIDLMCDLQEMKRNISQNAIVRRNALLQERQGLVDLMIESGIKVGTSCDICTIILHYKFFIIFHSCFIVLIHIRSNSFMEIT